MKLKLSLLIAIAGFTVLFILLPNRTERTVTTTLPGGVVAHLFEPATNNAVAFATRDGQLYLYSFNGLGEGKTWADVNADAYAVNATEQWAKALPSVPGGKGRLASTAVTVNGAIYVIGGYTVGEDGTEVSTPDVYAFDPATGTYTAKSPMPVPVDDSVAFAYKDHYIYLVSGWHDDGNVSNVQVYDTTADRWLSATPYPGAPVFGHAGGISGNRFVIADGVAVTGTDDDGKRIFGASDEAWLGIINPDIITEIDWQKIPPHPGNPLYRMAAAGVPGEDLVVFAGGSDNPYNYNGIGYDGVPSEPSASVFGFDIAAREWRVFGEKAYPTMDHRGMIFFDERFYIVGGMTRGQEVLDTVGWFSIEDGT